VETIAKFLKRERARAREMCALKLFVRTQIDHEAARALDLREELFGGVDALDHLVVTIMRLDEQTNLGKRDRGELAE